MEAEFTNAVVNPVISTDIGSSGMISNYFVNYSTSNLETEYPQYTAVLYFNLQ